MRATAARSRTGSCVRSETGGAVRALITSPQNAKVKRLRVLKRRKERRRQGLYLVEGIHHVGQAASAGVLESVLYAPQLLGGVYARRLVEELTDRVPCEEVTAEVLATVAGKENPQGIVAVARIQGASLPDLDPRSHPWVVAVVSAQDPGNAGTILRTIDAVGASALVLIGESVDPYHPTSVRASMGALFWHPVVEEAAFADFVGWAAEGGYEVYGTSARSGEDCLGAVRCRRPCVLLLGGEREGLASEQLAVCRRVLRLPMYGRTSSLNLSVAAGVILYAMLAGFEADAR